MRQVWNVATDLLREAVHRRWLLVLIAIMTVGLIVTSFALRLDVVDGALAGSRLFGESINGSIRAVDVALRPMFMAVAYLVFYGVSLFLILACADFAPNLLAPGRIESMLALPLRRWELLVGTYLGVFIITVFCSLYGAGGLAFILGVKTGVWTWRPIAAALLGTVGFSTIYAAMLLTATLVRSAALSAAAGAITFVLGVVAGYRNSLVEAFEPGMARAVFVAFSWPLPRLSQLAGVCGALAGETPIEMTGFASLVGGHLLFAGALVAMALWRFEDKDY